jgi:PII-like signaling protein
MSNSAITRVHEDDKFQGKPLHEAIVQKSQELDMAGATVGKRSDARMS